MESGVPCVERCPVQTALKAECRGQQTRRIRVKFDDLVKQLDARGGGSGADLKARAFTTGSKAAFTNPADENKLAAHEASFVVQQGPSSGFTKQGSKDIADGKAPEGASDRQRLRSSIAHSGVKCPKAPDAKSN